MRKRNLKKAAVAVFAAAVLMNMTACGQKGTDESSKTESTVESTAETESVNESTEAVVEDTTGEQAGEQENGAPESQESEAAAEKGSLEYVHQAVKEVYGDWYLPKMAIDADLLESMYGIPKDIYVEFIGEAPMISAQVDTFIAVRAKEGKGDEVESLMKKYQENLLENAMLYPMNLPVVNAAQIVREGDDVFFLMTGSCEALDKAETEEDMLKAAEEQVALGVETVKKCYE